MYRCFVILCFVIVVALVSLQADIVDRVAASVGNTAIKQSQIERDVRLTDFLNGAPLDFGAAATRASADRLIDQSIIRAEIAKANTSAPAVSDADAAAVLANLKRAKFKNDAEYRAALARYGISEPELLAHLKWQLAVLRFIEVRFRRPSEAAVNSAFFAWLDGARKHSRIQY